MGEHAIPPFNVTAKAAGGVYPQPVDACDIKVGQWYRCATPNAKRYFIGKLIDIFSADNCPLTEDIINRLEHALLIQLDIRADGKKTVHLRNTLSDRYPLPWKWFIGPDDRQNMFKKVVANSVYGMSSCAQDNTDAIDYYKQNVKGEIKMTNVENLITLINNKENADLHAASTKHDELIDEVVSNSDIGKAAEVFIKLARARDEDFNNRIASYVTRSILGEADQKKYDTVNREYGDKSAEIVNKYNELRALIRSVDSFEQALKLLKAYSVITSEVSL